MAGDMLEVGTVAHSPTKSFITTGINKIVPPMKMYLLFFKISSFLLFISLIAVI